MEREAFIAWFMAQFNHDGYRCTENNAITEWCNRCRSDAIVKSIDDNGDLCIKVFNVAKPWPHSRPAGAPAYPIVFPDPCTQPYADVKIDTTKFVIGSCMQIAGLHGAHWYNGELVILLHVHDDVPEATVALKSNGNLFDINVRHLEKINLNAWMSKLPEEDILKEMSLKATTLEKAVVATMTGDASASAGTDDKAADEVSPLSAAMAARAMASIPGGARAEARAPGPWRDSIVGHPTVSEAPCICICKLRADQRKRN